MRRISQVQVVMIMIHVVGLLQRISLHQVMAFAPRTTLTSAAYPHQNFYKFSPSFASSIIGRQLSQKQQHKSVVSEDETSMDIHNEEEYEEEYGEHHTNFSKKYVFIRKNKQSMAFRNGSPLVFSGSVERTVDAGGHGKKEQHGLEMGTLVGIVVSHENDSSSKDNKSKKSNSRFKGRGGRGGRGTQATKVKYNHDLIDISNNKVHTYNMDGNFTSSSDGIKEAQSAISTGKLIGYGFFNPVSMYRVFIFCHQTVHPDLFKSIKSTMEGNDKDEIETTEKVLELVLRSKVKDAIKARTLQGLPSESTDSYRLVNGEGDGLSGLAIDIIGGKAAVIMASAAWCELYRETILQVIQDILNSEHPIYSTSDDASLEIVWRNTPMRLKQDGYILKKNDGEDGNHSSEDEETSPVIVTENSIKYNTYPFDTSSQKTGFYCDQRENRLRLAQLCKGKRVLDLCCYNGGFALNAMIHGGATSCVGVDSSPVAIAVANENKELNGVSSALSFVQMDIADYMNQADEEGEEFDIIILDPPKLAPTIAQLERASRKYHSLNRDAMKLINKEKGGLLMTCTCSGAMTQKNGGQHFLETINGAALSAGRRVKLLSSNGAAPCHTQDPASFPANAYLTAALFSVSSIED